MKKQSIFIVFTFIFVSVILFSFSVMYPSGSPGGYTNSPLDNKTCTNCHGGSSASVADFITTDIPAEGCVAGNTYNITVSYNSSGNKGFELTSEANNAKVGQLISGSGTKLVNSNKAITHSSKVTSTEANWNFTWTAPAAGTGDVTFYSALVVNKPNIKLCSHTVIENTASYISEINKTFKLYPNPANNIINIETFNNKVKNIKIYNEEGKLCMNLTMNKQKSIDISELHAGIYTIVSNDNKSIKFIKK